MLSRISVRRIPLLRVLTLFLRRGIWPPPGKSLLLSWFVVQCALVSWPYLTTALFCGGVQVLPGERCSTTSSLGLFVGLGKTWVGYFHGCNFLLLALLLVLSVIEYNTWGFDSSVYVCHFRGVHALVVWLVFSLWTVMFLVCMGFRTLIDFRVMILYSELLNGKRKWNVQECLNAEYNST